MTTTTRCPRCDAEIRWTVTLAGARLAIDPTSHPDGVVIPVTTPAGEIRSRVLTGSELPAQTTAYRPHERTCPKGRDRARREAARRPTCPWCQQPMDPWLVGVGARGHIWCMSETAWAATTLVGEAAA